MTYAAKEHNIHLFTAKTGNIHIVFDAADHI